MTDYKALEKQIQDQARQWLESGEVKYVIGFEKGDNSPVCRPVFIYKPEDAGKLAWGPLCNNNLTKYLVEEVQIKPKKGEEPDLRPVGIVVKPCDSKTIVELMKENIVPRERVKIIGVISEGTINPKALDKALKDVPLDKIAGIQILDGGDNFTIKYDGEPLSVPKDELLNGKCKVCVVHNPVVYDIFVGDKVTQIDKDEFEDIADLEAMSDEERYEYWKEQLSKCIRCYACRDTCPLCYCEECVFDRTKPYNWNEKTVDLPENFFYHMVRAMHLAGRCVDCGGCERVCPMDIPIRKLNRFLLKRAKERFKVVPGINVEDKAMFGDYDIDDPGEGIK